MHSRVSASKALYTPYPPKTLPAWKTTKQKTAKNPYLRCREEGAAKTAPAKKAVLSTDKAAKAPYVNYRQRVEQGLPGSHNSKWLEAERSLAD